jgi:hypothetical protein
VVKLRVFGRRPASRLPAAPGPLLRPVPGPPANLKFQDATISRSESSLRLRDDYEFIYPEFIIDTMNSFLPRIQMYAGSTLRLTDSDSEHNVARPGH